MTPKNEKKAPEKKVKELSASVKMFMPSGKIKVSVPRKEIKNYERKGYKLA